MAKTRTLSCVIAGQSIRSRGPKGKEYLCLTDLYRAAGRPGNKTPSQWARLPDTRAFIAFQSQQPKVGKSHIILSEKGRYGGTWAFWPVAVKYAAYLSKALEDELIHAW